MKKLIAFLICTTVSFGLAAQDSEIPESRRNEIYIKPTGLFNFSGLQLEYKRQLKSGKYWTFGIDDLNIRYSRDMDPGPNTTKYNNVYNITLSTGIEKRKNITGALDLILGPNIQLGYFHSNTRTTMIEAFTDNKTVISEYNTMYSVGPGYKIGALYTIKRRFLVGAQFIPTLMARYATDYYTYSPDTSPNYNDQRLDFSFNLFNNSRLLIGYKF